MIDEESEYSWLGFITVKSYRLKVAKGKTYTVKPWRKQAQLQVASPRGHVCVKHFPLSDMMCDQPTEVLPIRKLTEALMPRVFIRVIHKAQILANPASAPAAFQWIQHSPKPRFKSKFSL